MPDRPGNFLTHDANQRRSLLNIHLQPGAKSNAIVGVHDNALKIRITAPAVDNKANTALVVFLSKLLGVAVSNITIRGGLQSRRKRIEIVGDGNQIETKLRSIVTALQD